MEYINIAPGLDFSRIVQGFWRLTDWKMSDDELLNFMEACIDKGVTTFDTAEIYGSGECEVLMGKALPKISRDKYQLVTKTGIKKKTLDNGDSFGYYDTRYDSIIESCKNSIKKLGCEYVDLYLIHREDPMINPEEVACAFKQLKKEGLVKEFGVSNFDPFKFNALNKYMDGKLRTNQIEWNPCCFEHFESGMVDVLMSDQIHPMIWSPLCGGRLFSDNSTEIANARNRFSKMADKKGVSLSTMVYAWILYHPMKAMPLVGSSKLERLDEAIAALDVKLEHSEWYELYTASKQKVLR